MNGSPTVVGEDQCVGGNLFANLNTISNFARPKPDRVEMTLEYRAAAPERMYKMWGSQRALLLFLLAFAFATEYGFSQAPVVRFKTIHVKFKEQFKPNSQVGKSSRAGIAEMDKISEKHKALSIKRIFPEAGVYEAAHRAFGLHLWYEINFGPEVEMNHAIADYQNLNYFHKVEESMAYTPNWGVRSAVPSLPTGTNDPLFTYQWHLDNWGQFDGTPGADINMLKAWQIETGSPNVIVAVIDGGINVNHPDLAAALWTNPGEIPGNRIDDDQNGYVDDVHGYGFGDQSGLIYPDSHATHVAGIIGAVSNNGIGVSGIAGGSGAGDGVRLMSCAGFGAYGVGGFEAAMVYAADNGAVISQNSWGGGSSSIEAAIDYFVNRAGYDNRSSSFSANIQTGPMAGGLVIFAAGNSHTDDPRSGYPASYKNAIAVASTDDHDVKSYFSNYGNWVDISAPGSDVYSTFGGSYGFLSGTSMACPQVSGVAALVASNIQHNGLTATEVWNRVRFSAHPIAAQNPSMNGLLGSGRVDAFLALQEPDAIPPSAIADLHSTAIHFSSLSLAWTATGNNGNVGQAVAYEMRYSTNPITEANFSSAILVMNAPVPPPAGEQVTFALTNLLPATTYYVALRSSDLFNNISGISNVLAVTTLVAPMLSVITTSLSAQLYTGGISPTEILVKNTGGDGLAVRLGVPDISPAPVAFPTGARGRLFAINSSKNTIEELNLKTGAIIASIPMPEPSTKGLEDLAFDGVNLYYGNSGKIYKLNAQTGQVLRSFIVNGVSTMNGLAWSGHYLYVSSYNLGSYKTYEVDSNDGTIIRSLNWYSELTFAGSRGTLFAVSAGELYEINIATGQVANQFNVGVNLAGVGYSGVENIVFVSEGSTIKAIQPDTGSLLYTLPYSITTALASDEYQPGWLTTEEQTITVASGATLSLPLQFVATGLSTGQWAGTVPVIPVGIDMAPIKVPATLSVTGATDIETASEINFNTQFMGFAIDSVISIENRGVSDLIVTDIHSNDSRVTASLSSVTLSPGQKVPMTVTVTPTGTGTIDTSITLTSNDPDEGVLIMPVRTNVLLPPAIEVSPNALSTVLSVGETTALNFTATNTGGSVLHWKANHLSTSSPGYQPASYVPASADAKPITQSNVSNFTARASSPEPVTCLSYDPQGGFLYARALYGNNFYRYDPAADSWTGLGVTLNTFSGQATSLNGKIYHGGTQLNIYNIQANSWSVVAFPIAAETGNLTNDGQYIYLTFGSFFYRYDPIGNNWLQLASLTRTLSNYGGLSCNNGVIFLQSDTFYTGDGNSYFFKYYIKYDKWLSDFISGKVSGGSAIDPGGRKYFIVGAPHDRPNNWIQMSILDLANGVWQRKVLPFTVGGMSGLAFVGKPGMSGIYIIQGNEGKGFVRYQTAPANGWLTLTPSEGNLAPGDTQNFSVALDATGLDAGSYFANLEVTSSHPAIAGSVPLTLTIPGEPIITMAATSADIGNVQVGRDNGFYLKFKNIGTVALAISDFTIDNPDFSLNPFVGAPQPPFIIPPGDSLILIPSFKPSAPGPQSGTFTFQTDIPGQSPLQFVLNGNGTSPPIPSITPGSLSADLFSGEQSTQNVTISNTGESPLKYYLDYSPAYWIKADGFGTVASGQSIVVPITLDATGKPGGIYEAHLRLTDDWDGHLYEDVPVSMTVTSAAAIFSSKQSLTYGDQYVNLGGDSVIQIKNNGDLPLSITTIESNNPVFRISIAAPRSLAPGESVDAHLRFIPTVVGPESGTITITSDDPVNGTYAIALTGNGVNPPVVSSDSTKLTVSAFTNEVKTDILNLSNTGGSALRWHISTQSDSQTSEGNGFTSLAQLPENGLMTPTIDPATGLIYAQATVYQGLVTYNPQTGVWSGFAGADPGGFNFKKGGAVILNSSMYCVYPEDKSKIHVCNLILADWESIPNGLGAGTGTITTDGTLLYLAGGGNFRSFNPDTEEWTDLPLPTINLDGAGGLSYFDGIIYAHEGSGNGFAKYTVATGIWENLPPVPDKAVLGSTIDPVKKRYYAYGKNGNSFLYEYDLTANLWNVIAIPLFDVSDGGMVFVPSAGYQGIYFIQGTSGQGFAKYVPQPGLPWLRGAPLTGEVTAADMQPIGINFNAFNLNTGTYKGTLQVTSNDPNTSVLNIPVTFNVTNPGSTITVPVEITGSVRRSLLYQTQLRIENKSAGALTWAFASALPVGLTASNLADTVAGFSFEDVDLTFDSNQVSGNIFDYLLQFNSNDSFNPVVSTRLNLTILDNHPPLVYSLIPTQFLTTQARYFSLQSIFLDPDGDQLTFSATTDNSGVATVSVSDTELALTPIAPGSATIEVIASDIFSSSVVTHFIVGVTQPTPPVTGIEPVADTGLQVFPNPFGNEVTIRYGTEDPGLVTIAVIDILGRTVWKVSGYQEVKGENEITIGGGQFVPGIYLCNLLRNGHVVQATKLVKN